MEIHFKYEIGSLVHVRQDLVNKRRPEDFCGRWLIIERHMQECQGGVQLLYQVRGNEVVTLGGASRQLILIFTELELVQA